MAFSLSWKGPLSMPAWVRLGPLQLQFGHCAYGLSLLWGPLWLYYCYGGPLGLYHCYEKPFVALSRGAPSKEPGYEIGFITAVHGGYLWLYHSHGRNLYIFHCYRGPHICFHQGPKNFLSGPDASSVRLVYVVVVVR